MFKSLTQHADVLLGLDMYGRVYELGLGTATVTPDDAPAYRERVIHVTPLRLIMEAQPEEKQEG